jgi:hypothetical protein
MQVDSWALALPCVVQAASWQGLKDWKTGERAEVTAPSSAQHLGIAQCTLVRLSTSSTALGVCFGVGLGDHNRRLQTARIMVLLQTFAGFFVRRAQLTERAFPWMRPLWPSLGVDAAGYAAETATTTRPPLLHPSMDPMDPMDLAWVQHHERQSNP